jgi:hypothetical protein
VLLQKDIRRMFSSLKHAQLLNVVHSAASLMEILRISFAGFSEVAPPLQLLLS